MGKAVEKKRKKKGRPSLLDLQKRNLKQQQQQHQQLSQAHVDKKKLDTNSVSAPDSALNYDPATPGPLRRSTRRNPAPDVSSSVRSNEDEEDEEEFSGKRREKKLKLVLKLPPNAEPSQESSREAVPSAGEEEEGNSGGNQRKRKIREIGDVSGAADGEKGEKPVSASSPATGRQGTQLDLGSSTPLPDKKLLVFILDRLQKKDTYGVFSEPVDPKELPDYHEVIERPMDFGTVRKKLTGGAYASLEKFEKDVFLICSNAMQYNAPDTVYFRQARSIQELAKKNFENLRQDSDGDEPEQKIVRRGRPPTKHLKKPLGKPSLDRAGSDFSSNATLANGVENPTSSNYDLRKGPSFAGKYGPVNSSGRLHYGSRNNDIYASPFFDKRHDRHDEYAGIFSKSNSVKQERKQIISSESRRNTYGQSQSSAHGHEPSVLSTFCKERKQLMAVGLHADHSYARSLARFAANLGPVAWKVASKKIEKSLPTGVKFGPGWVGEDDTLPQRQTVLAFSSPLTFPCKVAQCSLKSNDNLPKKHPGDNLSKSTAHSLPTYKVSPGAQSQKVESTQGLNSISEANGLNNSSSANVPRPSFQIPQSSMGVAINGINGVSRINIAAHVEKLIGAAKADGFNFRPPHLLNSSSCTVADSILPETTNILNVEDPRTLENNAATQQEPSQGSTDTKPNLVLLQQQRLNSLAPDLNVRFQSPGSPCSAKADTEKPDLALQL